MGFETAALVAIGAGTAFSAYNQIQAGNQAKKWGEYNASIARREAGLVREATAEEIKQHEGTQRALYAKSGVSLEGTPTDVMAADIAAIRKKGSYAASRLESQAYIEQTKGRQAQEAGYWGAGSTVLTGFGNAAQAKYGIPKKWRY